MTEETIQMLVDMGFEREVAENGVLMSGDNSVESALECLLAHDDDEMELSTFQEISASNNTIEIDSPSSEPKAKSFKCEDCKKVFAETGALEYHAVTSGHGTFSEHIEEKKPLYAATKRKLEDGNIEKIEDKRKRENEEEKLDYQRVKSPIKTDKLPSKIILGQESVEKQPKQVSSVTVNPLKQSKIYTTTKLQIRLTNGESIFQTFDIKEELAAVIIYIKLNRTDGHDPFCLMSFPKIKYTEADYEKSLDELGLVPSAVIILIKSPLSIK